MSNTPKKNLPSQTVLALRKIQTDSTEKSERAKKKATDEIDRVNGFFETFGLAGDSKVFACVVVQTDRNDPESHSTRVYAVATSCQAIMDKLAKDAYAVTEANFDSDLMEMTIVKHDPGSLEKSTATITIQEII